MQNLFTQLDKKIYGGFFHIGFGLNVNGCDKKAAFAFQATHRNFIITK